MEPSAELRQTLVDLYAAMSSGSAEAVEAFYSLQAGSIFMGTDEAEFWTDSAKHNHDVRPFFDGSYGPTIWLAGDAHAFVEGDVGWTVDRPTLLFGGETYRLRVSLVWHREVGAWRVVHSHASIGAPRPE
ncbi:MAG: nuclear transport factor 2 family protein [Dehalococcoidia bacterium]